MGFRFRKSIKILPGVKINLSKKGISSVSIGRPGATVNVNTKGETRATVGIPGTGLSYQKRLDKPVGKSMTECPVCGHRMRKKWDACPKCGAPLVENAEPPKTTEEIIDSLTPEERQAAYQRGKKELIRLAIISVIAILLIGSCALSSPSTSTDAGQPRQEKTLLKELVDLF